MCTGRERDWRLPSVLDFVRYHRLYELFLDGVFAAIASDVKRFSHQIKRTRFSAHTTWRKCCSPNAMTWSTHSRWIDPISLSGACRGCPSGHAQHSGRHSAPPWLPSIQKSRIHITYSATATAKTANAMEKTACLKMITILSSSKRRSHSLITGRQEANRSRV